jgi:hypothetical protein
MKLDPGMHIGLHLVCFSKTKCDNMLATHMNEAHIKVTQSKEKT